MDAAATVAVDSLDEIAAGARPLVVDEESGLLAAALAARGAAPSQWLRRAIRPGVARPWPEDGPFTSALVRLPRSKAALDLALHAAASVLEPDAPMVVLGANAEGIRSAASHLAAVAGEVATLAARRHCRLIAGLRRTGIAGLRASLGAWRRAGEISLLGQRRAWISYPGTFAAGGLDEGTALLVAHLPPLGAGAHVLDFAAGTGVIAAAVEMRQPEARLDLLEIDTLALEAARENVPRAGRIAGSSLAAAGEARYAAILSNPPIHAGVAEDHAVLASLIEAAPRHLARGGVLMLVVQRRVQAARMLERAFARVETVAETGRFRVLRGAGG